MSKDDVLYINGTKNFVKLIHHLKMIGSFKKNLACDEILKELKLIQCNAALSIFLLSQKINSELNERKRKEESELSLKSSVALYATAKKFHD